MMIYCVIPAELADELFDKLTEYYKDNPNVEVIVDGRTGPDRAKRQERGREARDPGDRAAAAGPGVLPRH